MNTTQTLEQMQQMRMQGMYHAYKSQLERKHPTNPVFFT